MTDYNTCILCTPMHLKKIQSVLTYPVTVRKLESDQTEIRFVVKWFYLFIFGVRDELRVLCITLKRL